MNTPRTTLNALRDAYEFVSGDPSDSSQAFLNRTTGSLHIQSDFIDPADEALPEDIDDAAKYLRIPHKRDLDLGKTLVLDFAREYLPDDFDQVYDIFRRKGAYSRFKDLLDKRNCLEQWYDFEDNAINTALREWCEDNGIELDD